MGAVGEAFKLEVSWGQTPVDNSAIVTTGSDPL